MAFATTAARLTQGMIMTNKKYEYSDVLRVLRNAGKVLQMHFNDYGFCEVCKSDIGFPVDYPCDTAKALLEGFADE